MKYDGETNCCSEGHELILHSLSVNDVKKIFFCGGTDNFYFMESVEKFKALGKPCPDPVTVMHESVAVYMNMGYSQWAGKPQVTMLHVDCGTINAGSAWTEAWHANASIVVIAGRTPWTTKMNCPARYNAALKPSGAVSPPYSTPFCFPISERSAILTVYCTCAQYRKKGSCPHFSALVDLARKIRGRDGCSAGETFAGSRWYRLSEILGGSDASPCADVKLNQTQKLT
jgi:hypothetical protein